ADAGGGPSGQRRRVAGRPDDGGADRDARPDAARTGGGGDWLAALRHQGAAYGDVRAVPRPGVGLCAPLRRPLGRAGECPAARRPATTSTADACRSPTRWAVSPRPPSTTSSAGLGPPGCSTGARGARCTTRQTASWRAATTRERSFSPVTIGPTGGSRCGRLT